MGVSSFSGLVDAVYVSYHSLYSRPMAAAPVAFLPSWRFPPITSADWPFYVLYDPYALLEFWPDFCSEAALTLVSNHCLFVID